LSEHLAESFATRGQQEVGIEEFLPPTWKETLKPLIATSAAPPRKENSNGT